MLRIVGRCGLRQHAIIRLLDILICIEVFVSIERTDTNTQTILIVGGADTGRAPMTAALLQRLLQYHQHPWLVGSAGVLGHDGSPPEPEARQTMIHMGLNIDAHEARSLTLELAQSAKLLITVDTGTKLVLQAQYADLMERVETLGNLAGKPRNIPDPFRMQIGAWITYAREITQLLEAALPQIVARMTDQPIAAPVVSAPPESKPAPTPEPAPEPIAAPEPATPQLAERRELIERAVRLVRTCADMPGLIDWNAARMRLEADFAQLATLPANPSDLIMGYTAMLKALLSLSPTTPTANQFAALQSLLERAQQPIDQAALSELSLRMSTWAGA